MSLHLVMAALDEAQEEYRGMQRVLHRLDANSDDPVAVELGAKIARAAAAKIWLKQNLPPARPAHQGDQGEQHAME